MSFIEALTKVRVVTRDKTYEFYNLEEAKQSFPELNPYRGGKNFTAALNDGDALLFETWEMNAILSSDD